MRALHGLVRVPVVLLIIFLGLPRAELAAAQPVSPAHPPPPEPAAELLFREVRYTGSLAGAEARFAVQITAECLGKGEAAATMFEGDIAVLSPKLPPGLRLLREGSLYRLHAARPGLYNFKLELIAKVHKRELWNQTTFLGPAAAIATVSAAAREAQTEVELLSGAPAADERPPRAGVSGVLGADRRVALRWQSRQAETARKSVTACETIVTAQVTPAVIKLMTQFRFEILQGSLARLAFALPTNQALIRVEGAQTRDWQVITEPSRQVLTVELLQPVNKSYCVTLHVEQAVEGLPFTGVLAFPEPLDAGQETGSLTVSAEDTVVETQAPAALRQVNAPAGALAAYQFHGRPAELTLALRRVEPVISVTGRITGRLEEARMLVTHALTLEVAKAGLYRVALGPLRERVATEVRGEGIEDWRAKDDLLVITFTNRVLGTRRVEVLLEQPFKALPETITLEPLRVSGADKQTIQVAVAAAPGLRLKTTEMIGLREIPVSNLSPQGDESLAYISDQPAWSLRLATERLNPRTVAEIFNLITLGDGLLGGSATVRYALFKQGLQEFKLRLPSTWKNVEFTGPNIRRKDLQGDIWTISLQDKAWGGYTLVVTYDAPFDSRQAVLSLGGIHALGVERETGALAVTSVGNLQLRERTVSGPLRRIDETDLAATDRALITRPVLLAYRQSGAEAYALELEVARFETLPVLTAVADRTQLTTVLADSGRMLTQAAYLVKNNDKPYQRFTLPQGAEFWSCSVDGRAVKAEKDGRDLLVPLPRGANRDLAFPVQIVYAQKVAALNSSWRHNLQLEAPRTDLQTTYAEWELYVPATHNLTRLGGNLNITGGTAYGWDEAWDEFRSAYGKWLAKPGVPVAAAISLGLGVLLLAAARRGRGGFGVALGVIVLLSLIAGMLSLSPGKGRYSPPGEAAPRPTAVAMSEVSEQPPVQLVTAVEGDLDVRFSIADGKKDAEEAKVKVEARRLEAASPALAAGKPAERSATIQAPAAAAANAPLLGDTPALGRSFAAAAGAGALGVEREAGAAGSRDRAGALSGLAAAALPDLGGALLAKVASVAGLRPLLVELPREGDRLLFTKVLNVREDKLQLSAWIIRTRVWNIARSSAQVLLLLTGLVLLWRQIRRPRPSSLAAACGLALALGGVGWWLLATRLLGQTLVIAVPFLALAPAMRWAWKAWKRRGLREPSRDARAPKGESPGPAPAVALLVVLLGVSTLRAEPAPSPAKPSSGPAVATPAPAVSILSANFTGNVVSNVARLEAVMRLASTGPNQTLVLFGEEAAIESFSATPPDLRLVRLGGQTAVRLARQGAATIQVALLVRLGRDTNAASRQLVLGIPPALSTRLALSLDEPEAVVEFPTAVSFQTVASATATRVEAVIGSGERLELRWSPRVKRAGEIAATVFCQNAVLASFRGGAMNLRATLDFTATQGELRELQVRLPAGQRLLRVEGDQMRTWQLQEGAEPILTVELLKGVAPHYRLVVETEKALERSSASCRVETPHARAVKRETGWVCLTAAEDLGVTVETAEGIQRVERGEFPHQVEPAGTAVAGVYQFLKPEFTLEARVEPLQPQLEAVVQHRLRVGAEELALRAQLRYTIKRAGIFGLRVALPAGFELQEVRGEQIARWAEKTEGEGRTLEVTLKQRTLGNYNLLLVLTRAQRELPRVLAVASVHPLGVQKLTDFVLVSSEAGVQTKAESFEGLTEVAAESVRVEGEPPNRPAGAGALAYKALMNDPVPAVQPWRLALANEAVEAWVRAEVVNWWTVNERLMSGRAQVRYEIQNAPVKEFRLRVPPGFRNVEVTGAGLRRRDQLTNEWRLGLQKKVIGLYVLTVTWELPVNVGEQETALPASGVEALGVERETGAVAIIAHPPLQVQEQAHSGELTRIDTSELPAWAGPADPATVLAYRYLRPGYNLALGLRQNREAEVLQALVDAARLSTVVARDGQMMTALALTVRNNGRQFLELSLPPGAQVWSAFVAGEAVRPSLRGGRVLLPLERSGAAASTFEVTVTYVAAGSFPTRAGTVELVSPGLDLPVKSAEWELYLPADHRYREFQGTMSRAESTRLPVLTRFTASAYTQEEARQKTERQLELSDSLSRARGELATGNVKEAFRGYNRARQADASLQENEEMLRLGVELKRAQSRNLIAGQQAAIANNLDFFGGRSEATPAAARPVELLYDAQTAEQQWEKLRQAQEIATTTIRPLRVNLPTSGLRLRFTQALATELGQPMRISFRAANAKAPDWTLRVGGGLAGLLGLWVAMAWLLPRRSSGGTTP